MKPKRWVVSTEDAPLPAGPYSQAVAFGSIVFLAGQTPRDKFGVRHLNSPLEEQVDLAMSNLERVANAAGSSLQYALKVTGYLKPDVDLDVFNKVYLKYMGPILPARTLIISDLKTGDIEVEAIVFIP